MSENTNPNQLGSEELKNAVIVVDDIDGFINTEKKLFEKGFSWYGLDLVIPKAKDGKNGFVNFKDNDSHLDGFQRFKHNTIIIPYGGIDGIKNFTGMTVSSIKDIPFLVKEREITKVIHYKDLDKYL